MKIVDKILSSKEFMENPPVLVDIGASGDLPSKWKKIAKYSICIAFDADERETEYLASKSSEYRRLYVFSRLLATKPGVNFDFFLTKSPYCSSTLRPDSDKLSEWAFADLFKIEKVVSLKSIDFETVFKALQLRRVDWFKTDSQGIDLRLFDSLGEHNVNNVLVAEFEAGIIDAYIGEDKLWNLMSYMDKREFWMSSMSVCGTQRLKADFFDGLSSIEKKIIDSLIRISPGWAGTTYFNSFRADFSKREYLLGWVFALIEKQYGFALELAINGYRKFSDPAFLEMKDYIESILKIKYYKNLPVFILGGIIRKFKRGINRIWGLSKGLMRSRSNNRLNEL